MVNLHSANQQLADWLTGLPLSEWLGVSPVEYVFTNISSEMASLSLSLSLSIVIELEEGYCFRFNALKQGYSSSQP